MNNISQLKQVLKTTYGPGNVRIIPCTGEIIVSQSYGVNKDWEHLGYVEDAEHVLNLIAKESNHD